MASIGACAIFTALVKLVWAPDFRAWQCHQGVNLLREFSCRMHDSDMDKELGNDGNDVQMLR